MALMARMYLRILVLVRVRFRVVKAFARRNVIRTISVVRVTDRDVEVTREGSTLLTVMRCWALMFLVRASRLSLVNEVCRYRLAVLTSLVRSTVNRESKELIAGVYGNFLFVRRLFTICAGRGNGRLTYDRARTIFPFGLIFLVIGQFCGMFRLVLSRRTVRRAIDGDSE